MHLYLLWDLLHNASTSLVSTQAVSMYNTVLYLGRDASSYLTSVPFILILLSALSPLI